MVKRLALNVACLVCLATAAHATIICVKTTGNDSDSGVGWDYAKKTVGAAMDASAAGDEVWVAAGVYVEKITLKSGVGLYGGFAGGEPTREERDPKSNVTVLDGGGSEYHNTVQIADNATSATVIDGFTLRHSGENCAIESGFMSSATISNNVLIQQPLGGTGIWCQNTVTISGNTISGYRQGIVCNNKTTANIVNNIISGNDTGIYANMPAFPRIAGNTIIRNGLGLRFLTTSSPVVTRNLIAQNGIALYMSCTSAEITGNVIRSNGGFTGSQGGGIVLTGCTATVIGNTIVDNLSTAHGAAVSCQALGPPSTIVNNIVASNSSGIDIYGAGTPPALHHNCLFDNGDLDITGPTDPARTYANLFVDPGLADLHRRNTHIQPNSPCMGSGDNTVVAAGSMDIDGQPRIQPADGTIDIGADESDGALWPVGPAAMTIRVRPGGNDANDGSSWGDAKQTVQAAIDAAVSGDQIWVAAGTYAEHLSLFEGVSLYGGFAGTEDFVDSRDFGANQSVIDGSSDGDVIQITTRRDTVLQNRRVHDPAWGRRRRRLRNPLPRRPARDCEQRGDGKRLSRQRRRTLLRPGRGHNSGQCDHCKLGPLVRRRYLVLAGLGGDP